MGGDHGSGNIVAPEPLLHGAHVGSALQQVGSEGMPKGLCADVLRQTGTANRHFDAENGYGAKLPENPTNVALSGQNCTLING